MKDFIIRWAALIGIGVASFFVGIQYERQTAQPQIVTKVEVRTKEVEKIVTKRVVVTKTVAADGTVTEKTETVDKVEDKAKDGEALVNESKPIPKPKNWSLGIKFDAFSLKAMPVGASVDRRILGDLWLGIDARWDEPSIVMGVSYEF